MSQLTKFFNDEYKNHILFSINTTAPAKVLKYNSSTKRADIQPLFLMANKDNTVYKQSPINDVPVLKHCQSDLKAGSLVFYSCAQRSLENLNGTNFIDPDSHQYFDSNDAVVIGVFDG
ncbi:Gp138 family membrane-puncturing spike protein [Heyndrickxia sporothermodurans]|uniref:Phage protein Gp138 N-terminal domain-containing protein n=1 Tax=Heyndrickxia sporothermodurans TaxID=46224 RepID=A0AB37HGN6_9BACI|nr:Gp138 family membrane-puncturing spike protein [Heyndrickxia sporothermodurans]MED1711706.1 Gp138 family membrane-puncturing spike protein [Bacillus thuringiensis]MBL5768236.1 hypothetical protein [Heyndrickxia sporothermodurans]MBL5771015.1 hypothetical protein [Heyndrickxia sporothermodurans]MBL5774689.1 hypothetical protein [Heyndrickxia sporothermodurans]MBL5778117.1 hypothetical protein [Heyndrickxia sporothermodurans]